MLEKPVSSDTNNNSNKCNNIPASATNTSASDRQQAEPTQIPQSNSTLNDERLDIINNFNHSQAFDNKGTTVKFQSEGNLSENCHQNNNKFNQNGDIKLIKCEKLVYGDQFDGNQEFILETESWRNAKQWNTVTVDRKNCVITVSESSGAGICGSTGEFLF